MTFLIRTSKRQEYFLILEKVNAQWVGWDRLSTGVKAPVKAQLHSRSPKLNMEHFISRNEAIHDTQNFNNLVISYYTFKPVKRVYV